jgi:hypothetical protein
MPIADPVTRHRKYLEGEIEHLKMLLEKPMLHQTEEDNEEFRRELEYFEDRLSSLNMCFA